MRAPLLVLACVVGLSGCHAQMQLSSGAAGTGAGVGVQSGVSGVSTLFWLGVAAAADGARPEGGGGPPPLDPARRVNEQDCSRPLEDPSANLKCR